MKDTSKKLILVLKTYPTQSKHKILTMIEISILPKIAKQWVAQDNQHKLIKHCSLKTSKAVLKIWKENLAVS